MKMNIGLKLACIAILGYVLVFSLKTPLVPGGLQVDTEKLVPGNNEFTYIGYNTHFLSEQQSLQVFVFFILTVAAAESAIGLAILVLLFRNKTSISVDELNTLKG